MALTATDSIQVVLDGLHLEQAIETWVQFYIWHTALVAGDGEEVPGGHRAFDGHGLRGRSPELLQGGQKTLLGV